MVIEMFYDAEHQHQHIHEHEKAVVTIHNHAVLEPWDDSLGLLPERGNPNARNERHERELVKEVSGLEQPIPVPWMEIRRKKQSEPEDQKEKRRPRRFSAKWDLTSCRVKIEVTYG